MSIIWYKNMEHFYLWKRDCIFLLEIFHYWFPLLICLLSEFAPGEEVGLGDEGGVVGVEGVWDWRRPLLSKENLTMKSFNANCFAGTQFLFCIDTFWKINLSKQTRLCKHKKFQPRQETQNKNCNTISKLFLHSLIFATKISFHGTPYVKTNR